MRTTILGKILLCVIISSTITVPTFADSNVNTDSEQSIENSIKNMTSKERFAKEAELDCKTNLTQEDKEWLKVDEALKRTSFNAIGNENLFHYGWNVLENNPDKICYKGKNDTILTGWFKDENNFWYYANSNGYILRDQWFYNNGNWYYLDVNGEMLSNCNIGDYSVNENGVYDGEPRGNRYNLKTACVRLKGAVKDVPLDEFRAELKDGRIEVLTGYFVDSWISINNVDTTKMEASLYFQYKNDN